MLTALRFVQTLLATMLLAVSARSAPSQADTKTLRVFIFAGQSNMVGSHSRANDIKLFPPFVGLDQTQENVMYSYSIGREDMNSSNGWTTLKPLGSVIGPEVSFARKVAQTTKAPIAIIKCASGGTTLGEDWNPDTPGGFKLYPLALQLIRSSLAELDRKGIRYRVEGFMWHQGENDMFSRDFKPAYAKNLKNFLARWRRDLNLPKLNFYIGELCTKTVWGMDNRENMHAIRTAQKAVTAEDPLMPSTIRTSQNAVEIGRQCAGLHYHYGTLGQLQHGEGYANAYLKKIGKLVPRIRPLKTWPFRKSSPVRALHPRRTPKHGRRASLPSRPCSPRPATAVLAKDNPKIPFKYSLGGGTTISTEPGNPSASPAHPTPSAPNSASVNNSKPPQSATSPLPSSPTAAPKSTTGPPPEPPQPTRTNTNPSSISSSSPSKNCKQRGPGRLSGHLLPRWRKRHGIRPLPPPNQQVAQRTHKPESHGLESAQPQMVRQPTSPLRTSRPPRDLESKMSSRQWR